MYQIWNVYGTKGLTTEYYIVNMVTKKVQSVWKKLHEARVVCNKLNVDVRREA